MKKNFLTLPLVILFVLMDIAVFAQPGDDDGSGGLEGNDPPPAPINTKLIWLVVLGLIYGYYSIRKYRKAL